MPKKKKSLSFLFNDEQLRSVRGLLADMIISQADQEAGITSRISEMGRYRLLPEMISPDQAPFERVTTDDIRVHPRFSCNQVGCSTRSRSRSNLARPYI